MNNRGFTLVELLAVIVILAIILTIAIPGISGIIESTTESAFESDAKMVLQQLNYEIMRDDSFDITQVNQSNVSTYGLTNTNYSDLRVGLIDNKPYIVIIGANRWNGLKVCGTSHDMQAVPSTDTGTCENISAVSTADYVASEGINKPILATGMTPVVWDGDSWEVVAEDSADWYSYTEADKKWANARTNDGSLWVWIPRYAYQIATNYHTSNAGTISIKFLRGNTNSTSDGTHIALIPAYSGSSQTNFVKHPAFTFGTIELTGIWVAKFEMSGTTASLDSKPGVSSLRSTVLVDMFTATRNMETNSKYGWELASGLSADGNFTADTNNIDTHVMKNTEWGATAYLSQSAYGKNAEITINNSSSCYTGGGTGNSYAANVSQSTTGNIYGIYDMSGGAWEYVMGNFNNSATSSGLNPISIADKYINRYTSYDNTKFGDAVYETSGTSSGSNSWYTDYSHMPSSSYSWFTRGGYYDSMTDAGLFHFYDSVGEAHAYDSWRATILVSSDL